MTHQQCLKVTEAARGQLLSGAHCTAQTPTCTRTQTSVHICTHTYKHAYTLTGGSDDFMDDVRKIALDFVYLAIGSMVGSFLQVRRKCKTLPVDSGTKSSSCVAMVVDMSRT